MVQLTKEQRVFIVLPYTHTGNTNAVQNAFRARFSDLNLLTKQQLWGTLKSIRMKERAWAWTKASLAGEEQRDLWIIIKILPLLELCLNKINAMWAHGGWCCNPIGVSFASFNEITRLDIRGHPYRMHVRHALLATDLPHRMHFVEWFIQRCQRENFLQGIIVADKAAFSMNGEVNTQGVRQYAPKGHPPASNFERHVSRAKLTVWKALCGNGVLLGPYFFLENVTDRPIL